MSSKPYRINASTVLIAGTLGAYNEYLQLQVRDHQMPWHPLLGQGSDFAAGAIYTALFLMYYHYQQQKYNQKLSEWAAPINTGVICTIGELTGLMGDTFDPKDIAAYWLGAGIAYAVHRAFGTNTLEDKIQAKYL